MQVTSLEDFVLKTETSPFADYISVAWNQYIRTCMYADIAQKRVILC